MKMVRREALHWPAHVVGLSLAVVMAGCGTDPTGGPPNSGDVSVDRTTTTSAPENGESASPKSDRPVAEGRDSTSQESDSPPRHFIGSAADEKANRRWFIELGDDDRTIRQPAREHFDALGEAAVDEFLKAMKDEAPAVRRGAVFGLLARFDPGDAKMVTAFINSLADENQSVRNIALAAVQRLNGRSRMAAIQPLAVMLGNRSEGKHNRGQAARTLGRFQTSDVAAIAAVFEALKSDPDRDVRAACLNAVRKINVSAPDAIAVYLAVLRNDSDARLRRIAAVRIGGNGRAAAMAAPPLADAMNDKNERVRVAVADALTAIGPDAIGPLVRFFDSDDRVLRILTIGAVGRMGAQAKSAVPELRKLRDDEDEAVRNAVEIALKSIESL